MNMNPGYKPSIHLPFDMDELAQLEVGMDLLIDNYKNTLKHTPGMKGSFLSDEDYKAFEECLRWVEGIKANAVEAQQKLHEQIEEQELVKRLLREEQGILVAAAQTHGDNNPTGCIKACTICYDINVRMEQVNRLLERD